MHIFIFVGKYWWEWTATWNDYENVSDIGYIAIKNVGDYENIHSVNPFWFNIGGLDRYIE